MLSVSSELSFENMRKISSVVETYTQLSDNSKSVQTLFQYRQNHQPHFVVKTVKQLLHSICQLFIWQLDRNTVF